MDANSSTPHAAVSQRTFVQKKGFRGSLPLQLVCCLVFFLSACVDVSSGPPDPDSSDQRRDVTIKILAINDFHGHLLTNREAGKRPMGGAAVLASYLRDAQPEGWSDRTFIVHAGDHVGASPPVSALLQDEPAIMFFNVLANEFCTVENRLHPRCNLVGIPGNHEFDEGLGELLRMLDGGNYRSGPFIENPYAGARFPYTASNIVLAQTGQTLLPTYVVKTVKGMQIGFVGAVLSEASTLVPPTGVAGLRFMEEVQAINKAVQELKERGVRAIVVLIHQGGKQEPYEGPVRRESQVHGPIVDIVSKLDEEVDLVISGHTHQFTNALIPTHSGKEILITQAYSYGTAYAEIHLKIDAATQDVVERTAQIVRTFADAGPGLTPDSTVAKLVAQAEETVSPQVRRVITQVQTDLSRKEDDAGESLLGDLIADAQRWAMDTDIAFMNRGGIHADLVHGMVTWGDLFEIHPFGNRLLAIELTGQQLYDVLNQQWLNQPRPRMLQVSGLMYEWDALRPVGDRVTAVWANGLAVDRTQTYTVTVNSYLAEGGDRFTEFSKGKRLREGPLDIDALTTYLQEIPVTIHKLERNRIVRRG
jgi:5'-nucleotidase